MYLSVDQVEQALATAASGSFSGFTTLISLPNKTWEGRQCSAVRLGSGSYPGKPTIFLLGGLHAREWGSPDILISFIEQLQDAYLADESITIGAATYAAADLKTLIENFDIIVFPQANPDGRNYSMTYDNPTTESTTDGMWRKNRRTQAPNSGSGDCVGVDLNRNFDFLWDFPSHFAPANETGIVDSTNPCDHDLYNGPAAFSEPETQNVKWVFDSFPNVGFFMDLHSYSGLVMYAWGDDQDQSTDPSMNFMNPAYDGQRGVPNDAYNEYIPAPDLAAVVSLANAMQAGVKAVRGTDYVVEPDYSLYPTAGTSDDYAYSRHFVDPSKRKILSLALEWGNDGTGFVPAYADMANIIDDVVSGLLNYCITVRNSLRACAIILDPSSVGVDEIDALRHLPGGPVVPGAMRVVVDGFTAAELGLVNSSSKLPDLNPTAGLVARCTGNTADSGGYGAQIQRFTFQYNLDFGPDDTAFGFSGVSALITVSTTVGGIPASALLELVKQPDPYMLHGTPPWLSVDLRVFVARPGETHFGQSLTAGASPTAYIRSMISALTQGRGTAGGESFESLSQDEQASSLYLYPTDNHGKQVFNFAIARVRYIGTIGAQTVRVFFRLFAAQSTSTAYDPSTTYQRAASNPLGQPIALPGILGSEYVTMPFFCFDRVDSSTQPLSQQVDSQLDSSGNPSGNIRNIPPNANGSEVDTFFGCWLDTNQPQNTVLPASVPAGTPFGPFTDPANPPLSIQQAILRSLHQCLVAEIAFDNVPIVPGEDPSNSDKLAQRNLAWSDVPNPGQLDSRLALSNFEFRPTSPDLAPEMSPDELMIDWGSIPAGSMARIYAPGVSATAVLTMADRLYTTHRLSSLDAHTIGCPAAGITYMPIPPGTGSNYAGLLSIELPAGITKGQSFDVTVRQVTNATATRAAKSRSTAGTDGSLSWRRVLGAFQLTIPVSTRIQLLETEERTLSVMRWIAEAIPGSSRWHPVFQRYLSLLAGRVSGFGGDPGLINPSPAGTVKPAHGRHDPSRVVYTGKIEALEFDRFGDFQGFVLLTENGEERRFLSREQEIRQLVDRAWLQRFVVSVITDGHHSERPISVVLRRAPRP